MLTRARSDQCIPRAARIAPASLRAVLFEKTPRLPGSRRTSPGPRRWDRGSGYAQLEFGEKTGPDLRYVIARRVGWGMQSDVWLARDQSASFDGHILACWAVQARQLRRRKDPGRAHQPMP
jgi:hypothetical protein